MSSTTITLTTDFGTRDGYVGAVKGVMLSIAPDAAIVDISHDVPPQDISHGAFVLGSAYRYFSADTIHLAVVDPGVGTARRALLLVTPKGRFLAPDNGLLTYVVADQSATSDAGRQNLEFMRPVATPVPDGCLAYTLTNTDYWLHAVSDTFHGRDIFAPVAAHISRGVSPEVMGDVVDDMLCLNIHPSVSHHGVIEGQIIFVDHFGNLIGNVRGSHLAGRTIEVELGGAHVKGLGRTFADGDGLLALIGSHGYLEIVENEGSAAEILAASVGSHLRVTLLDDLARS